MRMDFPTKQVTHLMAEDACAPELIVATVVLHRHSSSRRRGCCCCCGWDVGEGGREQELRMDMIRETGGDNMFKNLETVVPIYCTEG